MKILCLAHKCLPFTVSGQCLGEGKCPCLMRHDARGPEASTRDPMTGKHTHLTWSIFPSRAEPSGRRTVLVRFHHCDIRLNMQVVHGRWDGKHGDLWSLWSFFLFFFLFSEKEDSIQNLDQIIESLWICNWQPWNLLALISILFLHVCLSMFLLWLLNPVERKKHVL